MEHAPLASLITHIRQTGDWDCGIACVQMILDGRTQLPPQAPRSVWTVDLAYLLHSLGIKFNYTTITLGANLDYSTITFYASVQQDAARVNDLFRDAAKNGITIEKKHVHLPFVGGLTRSRSASREELIAHVKGGGACIVLADNNYLVCNKCAPRWWKKSAERVLPPSSYRGHYIILIGWSDEKEEFSFRDPDRADDTCFIYASQLDTARKRVGTDEDIIWIHPHQPIYTAPSPPPAHKPPSLTP